MAAAESTFADSCKGEIRNMILTGELLPGQKIYQAAVAQKLNVSRVPVREALSSLEAEGVVVWKPNTGYTVGRFDLNELVEIYLMRRLLETELLRATDLTSVDVEHLSKLNEELRALSFERDRQEFDELNRRFHFALFEYSRLQVVNKEVSRLWHLSMYYRSMAWRDESSGTRICADHDLILTAIRAQDIEALVQACDAHRTSTEELISNRLSNLC